MNWAMGRVWEDAAVEKGIATVGEKWQGWKEGIAKGRGRHGGRGMEDGSMG